MLDSLALLLSKTHQCTALVLYAERRLMLCLPHVCYAKLPRCSAAVRLKLLLVVNQPSLANMLLCRMRRCRTAAPTLRKPCQRAGPAAGSLPCLQP